MSIKVAIIGAGMAGSACARTLYQAGMDVTVFEKSRGPGGRMATRRVDDMRFDHGAQYAAASSVAFQSMLLDMVSQGKAGMWPAPGRDRTYYVGQPGMNAIPKALLDGVPVRYGARIEGAHRTDAGWRLLGDVEEDDRLVDWVLSTAPAPQTTELFDGTSIAAKAQDARYAPCVAVMVRFEHQISLPDVVRPHAGPLIWAARNSNKPGRVGLEQWVLHGDPAFSEQYLDGDPNEAIEPLLAALAHELGGDLPIAKFKAAHRWRYSRVTKPLKVPCLIDVSRRLGAAGDWCLGGRVESAFLSGTALSTLVMNSSGYKQQRDVQSM